MFSDNQDGDRMIGRSSLITTRTLTSSVTVIKEGHTRPSYVRSTFRKYMLIDWVNPFRAIYFPIAHKAGPGHEDLCVYLMIDFRLRQSVTINSPGHDKTVEMKFDRDLGLYYRHTDVMSFDLKGIYNYLMLPQQLRNPDKDLYTPKNPKDGLITLWDCSHQEPIDDLADTRPFYSEIDLAGVINDKYGVDVTWQPYEYSSWVGDFLYDISGMALAWMCGTICRRVT